MLENRTAAHQSDPLQFNSVGCLPLLGGSHSLLPNVSPCQSVNITPRHSIAQHVSPSTAHGEGPMAGSNILVRWCLLFTSGVWFTSEPRGSVSWVNRGKQLKQQMHWRDTFYPFHLTTTKRNVRTFPSDAHLKGGQQTVFFLASVQLPAPTGVYTCKDLWKTSTLTCHQISENPAAVQHHFGLAFWWGVSCQSYGLP